MPLLISLNVEQRAATLQLLNQKTVFRFNHVESLQSDQSVDLSVFDALFLGSKHFDTIHEYLQLLYLHFADMLEI